MMTIVSSQTSKDIDHRSPVLKSRFSKEEYKETIQKLQQHILRGDCYEINFCQEFYSDACCDRSIIGLQEIK